jgi:spore coat protein CotH
MAEGNEISGLNRREFIIRLGGGALGLGLFTLFPVLGTSCSSLVVEGQESDSDSPFNIDKVLKVYIVMEESDWVSLIANAADEKYKQADLWYGSTVISDIAIRAKGNYKTVAEIYPDSIRYSLKADLNLLNAEQNLDGVKKLNFNNNWGDPGFMREVLGYELFKNTDIPAPRASFIDLWVNDIHLGLYTMVEQVDKAFIERNFTYTNGNLYKPEKPAGNLAWTKDDLADGDDAPDEEDINIGGGSLDDITDVVSGDDESDSDDISTETKSLIEQMCLKTNESTSNHTVLYKLLEVLNNEPDDTFATEIEKVLDVNEVLRYLAVSTVMVHLDNYIGSGENYYLYENDGRFVMIPWDLNLAFGTYRIDLSMEQTINYYIDEPTCGAMSAKPLVSRLLSNAAYLEKYHEYIEEVLDGVFDSDTINARIDELAGLIRSYVKDDETKFYTAEQFEEGISEQVVSEAVVSGNEGIPIGLKYFVEQRSQSIRAQLNGTLASASGTGAGNGTGESTGSGSSAGVGGAVIALGSTVTVTGTGATVSGNVISITKGGNYEISGTLEDGQIIVNADDASVNLVLNGVNIKCSDSAPIYILDAEETTITLADGTDNYVTDSSSYVIEDVESGEPDAAIFSKDNLVIDGAGSLSVSANYNNGITGKDALTISGGNIVVNAVNDGIRGRDSIVVAGGTVAVTAGGDGMQSNNDEDATLGNITVTGGKINITAGADGLQAETDIIISGGDLAINADSDGINGKNSVNIMGGSIIVDAASDGIQSSNAEDATLGYIVVGGGTLNITAGGDGIQAETDITISGGELTISSGGGSANGSTTTGGSSFFGGMGNTTTSGDSCKGMKAANEITITGGTIDIDSADDAIHSDNAITIWGGGLSAAAGDDGIHAESSLVVNEGTIDITKCYEGLEAPAITINGGDIHIVASDDGINGVASSSAGGILGGMGGMNETGAYLYINGGYIYVNAAGDGIDIGGSIEMTDGTVLVNGPTNSANGALDFSSFNMKGGTIVAAGSSGMAQSLGTSSSQYSVAITYTSSQAAGTIVHIESESGDDILTFAPAKTYQSVVFSSPQLKKGGTYTVYSGGSSTGAVTDGLYSGGTYSGGTQYTTFTVSSVVTTVGSTGGSGGMFPGGGGGMR